MGIEKNSSYKGSRFDPEISPNSRESMSSDDDDHDEVRRLGGAVSAVESDGIDVENDAEDDEEDNEFDDADSGAGSDDFDLLELGETGAEFCQIGNLTCSVPFELYDLSGLEDILSIDVWNDVLTEDERFNLTKYLPDLDQFTFMRTLKDLFEDQNFHFGSPIKKLFEMLKGGLCEPRVALYREGLSFFQKRQHYHLLRSHQNNMVSNICQIRDAWFNCRGYSIEEKLRVLNIMKSQKSLMNEKMEEDLESDSSEKDEFGDEPWSKRIKDRKGALKLDCDTGYDVGANLEFPSRIPSMGLEVSKYGKQNQKGMLKLSGTKPLSAKEATRQFPSLYHGVDINSSPFRGFPVPVSRQKAMAYDSGTTLRQRDQMRDVDYDDDAEDMIYGMRMELDRNMAYSGLMEKSGVSKSGKKHELLRSDGLGTDNFMGVPFSSKNDLHAYGRNRNMNQLSEVKRSAGKPSNLRTSHEHDKRVKENFHQYAGGDQMKSLKGRTPRLTLKGNPADMPDHGDPIWHGKNQALAFSVDSSMLPKDRNMRSKKWKTGKEYHDLNFKTYGSASPQVNDSTLLSELRAKPPREKIRGNLVQNGGLDKGAKKSNRIYARIEDTESDSSEHFDNDDEDINPLMRSKSTYSSGMMEGSRSLLLKAGRDAKKGKFVKKEMQENTLVFDGMLDFSRKAGGFNELGDIPEYYSKEKQKGKMCDISPLHNRLSEKNSPFNLVKAKDDNDRKRSRKLSKNGQLQESGENLYASSPKAYPSDRKLREVSHGYAIDEEYKSVETSLLLDENGLRRFGKKGQGSEAYMHDLGFKPLAKKRKAKEELIDFDGRDENGIMQFNIRQQLDDSISLKKKGKSRLEADVGTSEMEPLEPPIIEMGTVDMDIETKPPPKKPYTPITPTVHTGFSFSVIHLLSAVRMAMVSSLPEDSLEVGKSSEEQNGKPEGHANGIVSHENVDANKLDDAVQVNVPSLTVQEIVNGIVFHENVDANKLDDAVQVNVPSLTVQEIVNRVRSNPGDPYILETQELLQDLVRGVLRIFLSKTAPLGAKGWKALVAYEKSTKSWSWIGPLSCTSTDHETMEEVTSPEYWGLPHKMLVKVVDSFANWLKSGQETLQQIGSLPAPPVSLMQCNLDEKERFKDLRAQKSLNTISQSSEEVRDYFRKEEVLRYSIPDRAFLYTAADGKKSIVAPLRRGGGKPTSKARDHFMLKRDRPPHVTILCLVRDAASRLPGSIGTRADVCTLIRDSQYIVEDVSDAQVNQVVSGALDRLHYERDPCVQFDGERKLWVYLHREREEEDFEDDGTSSTKKWKRQKKDPADQPEQGAVTVAFHANDQSGFDLGSDLNAEPPATIDDKRIDLVSHDGKQTMEDIPETSHVSDQGNAHQMVWGALSLDPIREHRLLCQENSTNEEFDDETLGRERPMGLLSASLS